jgi:acyl-CoA synthetase (NDP forming)
MNSSIEKLMKPASIAVIGASTDPKKTAGRPIAYLKKHHYAGLIYPVNPRVQEIDGLKCYPDIASLPQTPDVAIILLGTDRTLDAVKELAARGTPAAIVLTSGFAEHGQAGLDKQEMLIKAAGTMRILGPNTIGMVNITDTIPLSASSALEMDEFPKGSVSVVSQSGGILGAFLSRAVSRGLGLSKLISTSNEADLGLADFIDYLVDDASTRVIALYIESIRQPERFRAAAKRAQAAGKPIVAFKVGKSQAGIQAAISHTGALAGSDKMYDALFAQTGVIRAQQFADFLDIPTALSSSRILKGNRVAILTSTGGAGTLVADSLGASGFETPAPDEQTASSLRALQPGDQAVLDRNPIDVTLAGLQPDLLRGAIAALLESPSYDALVLIVGSSGLAMPDLMASAVSECMQKSDKPVIAYISPHAPVAATLMTKLGVPAFTQPESCSVALASMRHAADLKHQASTAPQPLRRPPADVLDWHGALNEYDAKSLFASFGVDCVRELKVKTDQVHLAELGEMGERVVLKILSSQILHKTEVGGVAVSVPLGEVTDRLKSMSAQVRSKAGIEVNEFLIQEMIRDGFEMMVGMHKDPLGTAILVGMGGVTAELFKDTQMTLLEPGQGLTSLQVRAMLERLTVWPLLSGYRGAPLRDVDALVDAVVAFSSMVASLQDRLMECEINPIFVLNKGLGAKACDGVVVLN